MQSTPLHHSLTGGQHAVENNQFSNKLHRSSGEKRFLNCLISHVFLWQLSFKYLVTSTKQCWILLSVVLKIENAYNKQEPRQESKNDAEWIWCVRWPKHSLCCKDHKDSFQLGMQGNFTAKVGPVKHFTWPSMTPPSTGLSALCHISVISQSLVL